MKFIERVRAMLRELENLIVTESSGHRMAWEVYSDGFGVLVVISSEMRWGDLEASAFRIPESDPHFDEIASAVNAGDVGEAPLEMLDIWSLDRTTRMNAKAIRELPT